jgi:hypothetical protein
MRPRELQETGEQDLASIGRAVSAVLSDSVFEGAWTIGFKSRGRVRKSAACTTFPFRGTECHRDRSVLSEGRVIATGPIAP